MARRTSRPAPAPASRSRRSPSPSTSATRRARTCCSSSAFFFTDPAPTEIYTLSLHDALPICGPVAAGPRWPPLGGVVRAVRAVPDRRLDLAGRAGFLCGQAAGHLRPVRPWHVGPGGGRSEEHTSELQSRPHLVCRLLLEKKKK